METNPEQWRKNGIEGKCGVEKEKKRVHLRLNREYQCDLGDHGMPGVQRAQFSPIPDIHELRNQFIS